MVLVLDVLAHTGRKIQKLKFVRNSAPDNQRVLNFMPNPKLARILVIINSLSGRNHARQTVLCSTPLSSQDRAFGSSQK